MCFSTATYILHYAVHLKKEKFLNGSAIQSHRINLLSIMFHKYTLVVINLLFLVLCIITAVYCILSISLLQFLRDSVLYIICTTCDCLYNFLYAAGLLYYGGILRLKLLALLKDFPSQHTLEPNSRDYLMLRMLTLSLHKLIGLMVICVFCFLLRVFLLCIILAFLDRPNSSNPFHSWLPTHGK